MPYLPVRSLITAGCLVLSLWTGGCTVALDAPDLGVLYDRAARDHGPDRRPIIVIPGTTGSNLADRETGRVVWGAFAGDYARPGNPDDLRLLALPMERGVPLEGLRDEVVPAGVLDRVRVKLLGIPLHVKAYVRILSVLGAGGYRDQTLGLSGAVDYGSDHYTCFQFDYDWRRDNVENARRLARFIRKKKEEVREETMRRYGREPDDLRFDIVAHSMGGVLLRYFLRYGDHDLPEDGSIPEVTWEGAAEVKNAILVGPPNGGSLAALFELVEGHRPGPMLPLYPAMLLGTYPSVYQLLPRSWIGALQASSADRDPVDLLDPSLWERMGWGLASRDQEPVLETLLPDLPPKERRQVALDHLRKSLDRARRLARALDSPASPPPGHLGLYLVAGDAEPTPSRVVVEPRSGRLRVVQTAAGDGTVLRSSALLDARKKDVWRRELVSPIPWSRVLFLFRDHLGLTEDATFSDNVLYWLLEEPSLER